MKKNLIQKGNILIILTLVVVIAVAGLSYVYFNNIGNIKQVILPITPSDQSESQITGEAQIAITRTGFIPTTITVKKGTQVTWTNKDNTPHTLMSDQLPNLDTEESLNKEDSSSYVFDTSGTFTYYGKENLLKFTGTVIVK